MGQNSSKEVSGPPAANPGKTRSAHQDNTPHLQTVNSAGIQTDRNARITSETTTQLNNANPGIFCGIMVPKKKTYGAKRTATSSAANAIFGRNAIQKEHPASSRPVLSDITDSVENIDVKEDPKQVDDTDDVAAALERIKLHDDFEKQKNHGYDPTPKAKPVAREKSVAKKENKKRDLRPLTPPHSPDATLVGSIKTCEDSEKSHDHDRTLKANSVVEGNGKENDVPPNPESTITLHFRDREQLRPLLSAYRKDRGVSMPAHNWAAILPTGTWSVHKIAEASYAEVYRIIEDKSACVDQEPRSSILKVMRLQTRRDPTSLESENASRVEDVVSEIRIMNALTEIPGYVQFKEAYIVKGETEPFLTKAWEDHNRTSKEGSYFPHPSEYIKNTIFLVTELGDAGITLDDYNITKVDEAWDIFLGTVLALAKAEEVRSFEHRDLHENNICVAKARPATTRDTGPTPKYGNSGIEVTIIDYGLSRATLENGETLWYPLENDLAIFQSTDGVPQYNAYRKMRNHLFTGFRVSERRAWHDEDSRDKNNGHTWEEFIPYTNVIWLHYFLGYLKRQCAKIPGWTNEDQVKFQAETKDIFRGMDTRTKVENGAFMSAVAVLKYCVDAGLIDAEQGGFESSEIFDE